MFIAQTAEEGAGRRRGMLNDGLYTRFGGSLPTLSPSTSARVRPDHLVPFRRVTSTSDSRDHVHRPGRSRLHAQPVD